MIRLIIGRSTNNCKPAIDLNFPGAKASFSGMKRLLALLLLSAAALAGCANLDERQRGWIFQPSDRTWWRGEEAAQGMQDVWIDFASQETGEAARLHGLWATHELSLIHI